MGDPVGLVAGSNRIAATIASHSLARQIGSNTAVIDVIEGDR